MSAALIYLRVSTEEQAERGYSIAAQREECRTRAWDLGADEILEFVDEGVSGSILERPALVAAQREWAGILRLPTAACAWQKWRTKRKKPTAAKHFAAVVSII